MFWRRRHEIRDEELSAYVDGELSSTSLDRVEEHLETCAACRETVAELRALHEAVSGLPHVRAPRSFALRETDVATVPAASRRPFSSAMPLLSGVAAIAIVAFVVLAGVDVSSDAGDRGDTAGAARQESAAPGALEGTRNGVAYSSDDEYSPADDGIDDSAWDSAVPPAISEPSDVDAGDTEGGGERNGFGYDAEGEITSLPDVYTNATRGNSIALSADDGDDTGLRIAEGIAAAVAISAGGAALFIWWRRRQSDSI